MNTRPVEGSGPYNARLLLIGEAPGLTEQTRGIPFIGVTGQKVRRALRDGGLDRIDRYDSTDVRFNNVVPHFPGKLTKQADYKRMLELHHGNIDDDITRTSALVIVACGALALRRLTGMTDIVTAHGGVYPARAFVEQLKREMHKTVLIPSLHPAGAMHTKTGAEWVQINLVLKRAARYATGELRYNPIVPSHRLVHANELTDVLQNSNRIFIDTEFDRGTKVPFLCGIMTDKTLRDAEVLHFDPRNEALSKILNDARGSSRMWVAHYHLAELESLSTVGINLWDEQWYDTMAAFALLYSDVRCDLSYMCRHYLDDVHDWKWMDVADHAYNARDVHYMARAFPILCNEITCNDMDDVLFNEAIPALVDAWQLEQDGIFIDIAAQHAAIAKHTTEQEEIVAALRADVGEMLMLRTAPALEQIATYDVAIEEADLRAAHAVLRCLKHPKYFGMRGKKWVYHKDCTCQQIYATVETFRKAIRELKLLRTKLVTKVKKWNQRGFVPSNDFDLRWLLYDKAALGLPPQSKQGTKLPSVDVTTLLRLGSKIVAASDKPRSIYHVDNPQHVLDLISRCKEVKHAQKLISTFLKPPIDNRGFSHPPLRPWGTGTGRPVSGNDDLMSDRRSTGGYNALNIPKMCRRIFIPSVEVSVAVPGMQEVQQSSGDNDTQDDRA